jgi:hypothetical protein
MKVETESGQEVDLNESLTKADLVALVKHWRTVAMNMFELHRRTERAIALTMAVTSDESRETLIKKAINTGYTRAEAEQFFPPDPPDEVRIINGKERRFPQRRKPIPIMSESFLYPTLGKEVARSLLYPLEHAAEQLRHPSWYRERYDRQTGQLESLVQSLKYLAGEAAKKGEKDAAEALLRNAEMLEYFLEDWVITPKVDWP